MVARGIKFKRGGIANVPHLSIHGFRLSVEVTEVNGDVPKEVFLYMQHPADPDGNIYAEWVGMASFVDLAEYPVDVADPNKELAIFRASSIEVDVRSMALLDYIWTVILQQAESLLNAMNKADDIRAIEERWVGEPSGTESAVSCQSESVSVL